jgi:1-deoxy-D-xylulose-5-phosphate reductoisomerase
MQRRVIILGATGSIGTQALDIIRANPDKFKVVGLSAGGNNIADLARFALEFEVDTVAIAHGSAAQDFQLAIYAAASKNGFAEGEFEIPRLLVGPEAATLLAGQSADVVLNGISGAVGLGPTVAALNAGTTLALANKESLVIGGKAVTALAKPGQIVPVDSEHSALAQCLLAGKSTEVYKLVLTASGGPFRGYTKSQLEDVTVEQALKHPTWAMGPVVTVNSATMMNKGLEIIEAHLLFDIPMDRIEVVVHPQSVVHSMVEFVDGSTIAQASPPDMHLPIALGLSWPDRIAQSALACDWATSATWTFEPVNEQVFPAVALAKQVGTKGGTAPAVMNGANEVAVAQFLAGALKFSQIVPLVSRVVEMHLAGDFVSDQHLTIEEVTKAAKWAQQSATAQLDK